MDLNRLPQDLPYPIASVYATLDDPLAGPPTRREALHFTVYQLMRTVGLTLVGQYFTQDLPPDASSETRRKLNEAILRVRFPHFIDWIGLLETIRKRGPALQLDFFPEFKEALHIDLWMSAFDGREASAITEAAELFTAYLDDIRARFPAFWANMSLIIDHMLRQGRMELTDVDAHDIRAVWEVGRTEFQRREFAYDILQILDTEGRMPSLEAQQIFEALKQHLGVQDG